MIEHRNDREGRGLYVAAYAIRQQKLPLTLTLVGLASAVVTYQRGPGWWTLPLAAAVILAVLLHRRIADARLRSDWTRAIIEAGGAPFPKEATRRRVSFVGPRPGRIERTASGERIHLKSPTGYSAVTPDVLEGVRAALDVRDVRLERDPDKGSRAVAIIERRDSLRNHAGIPSPLLKADTANVWDPLPLGVDDDHQPITIATFGNGHLLVAGITGSGKTVALNQLIAQAALDATCKLTIIDGAGGVDYSPWATVATIIDDDVTTAADTLERIRDEINHTKTTLLRNDASKVGPGDPVHRIILDEAGFYFNNPDPRAKDDSERFRDVYLDLMQRGRKFGLQFVLGMQRPAATILSTDVRAQFGYRICFRTGDRETTRMAFPESDAPAAHEIPENGYAGVGYLKGEGGRFRRFKGYWLSRDDQREIASRGYALRLDTAEDDPRPAEAPVQVRNVELPANDHEGEYPVPDTIPADWWQPDAYSPFPAPNPEPGPDVAEQPRSGGDAPQGPNPDAYDPEHARRLLAELRRQPGCEREHLASRLRKWPTWYVALRVMLADGRIVRTRGGGKTGRAFRHWLPEDAPAE